MHFKFLFSAKIWNSHLKKKKKIKYPFELAKKLRIIKKLPHFRIPGMMDPHGTIHELNSVLLTRFSNFIKLLHVHGDRLLHQQMLLTLGHFQGPFYVQRSGQRQIDGVDSGVFNNAFIRATDLDFGGAIVGSCKASGFLKRTARHGGENRVGREIDGSAKLASYVCAADYAETDWGLSWSGHSG